jgi:hypothetical protein
MIKSRRMKWEGHVARIREKRNTCRILVGRSEVINHYEDLDVGGMVILTWILERYNGVL